MILSEKITELRKKNGLSQEALGEKLGVSRQAVSKWEMAQSVPDLNKVIEMAKVFGVSTDLLLMDTLDLADMQPQKSESDSEPPARTVTLSEANSYLAQIRRAAGMFAVAILLLVLSPAAGILLSSTGGDEKTVMPGAVTEVLLLIAAVITAVLAWNGLSPYRYLKKERFELEYGVTGVVKEQKQQFAHTRLIGLLTGIALCLGSVLPLMVCSTLFRSDAAVAVSGVVMLAMIACGAAVIVRNAVVQRGFTRLLRERQ